MKKYSFLLILICLTSLNAQKISDYKYVIIPDQFTGFDAGQYKLNSYLNNLLKQKNYEIISEDRSSWPSEVVSNPCLAVTANADKQKKFLKNKIELTFTDCNKNVINSYEGISSLSDTGKGYQDALKTATLQVALSFPKNIPAKNSKIEESDENGLQNTVVDLNKIYKNESETVVLNELKDGSFILVNQQTSQIKAQFYPASKPGVYHVKLVGPEGKEVNTVGFIDNNSIDIEYPENNNWKVIKYQKVN